MIHVSFVFGSISFHVPFSGLSLGLGFGGTGFGATLVVFGASVVVVLGASLDVFGASVVVGFGASLDVDVDFGFSVVEITVVDSGAVVVTLVVVLCVLAIGNSVVVSSTMLGRPAP